MKKISFLFAVMVLLVSCKEALKDHDEQEATTTVESSFKPYNHSELENAIIYEANIRQYSDAGTFNEFTKDIPELKKLGVKVIWLMPVFPISEKNRKAKGDLMVHDIEDPKEREKYLGSYYSIADYEKVNPEFGTKGDLDKLIETAHDNGMYVILDWVANHTGWDNWWIDKHPEYYTQNENGEIIHPAGTDWTDTADLNYENKDVWKAMTASMKYWVENHNIDGFRCDVAHEVPIEFWNYAVKELEQDKELFMLAESEKKDLFYEAFDMGYNWEGHHLMNELAQGKKPVTEWDEYMKRNQQNYQADDILMNFITNHDENSWNGTVKERMGDASELMLSFQYMIPGMPLIYSGQEYGMDHRLKFFEKDMIPKEKGNVWEMMEKLGDLKQNHPALKGGKEAASYERLTTTADDQIYAIKRSKGDDHIIYMANLSDDSIVFKVNDLNATATNLMNKDQMSISKGQEITLHPYEYLLLDVK